MNRHESASRPPAGPEGKPHVVVVGLMGAGKSTTGSALADALGVPFADSDADITTLTGRSGSEIAATDGVPALHRLEAAVLLGALARSQPTVIAAAASVVEDDTVREALARRATVVRLVVPQAETLARQKTGEHRRPMSADELTALAARREPYFQEIEDLRLDATVPTRDLVSEILAFLPQP